MERFLNLFISTFFPVILQAQDLPVLKITINSPISESYSEGLMSLTDTDNTSVEMKAKFKTRGATALSYPMKPSLNMKLFNEDFSVEQDSLLLGIRSISTWILDAMAIDRICMRNRVCFDIWNEMSRLPYETSFNSRNGTEGKYIELYINENYYGIYCLTDRINRKLLNLKKTEVTDSTTTIRGVLYKHGTTDTGNQENPGFFNDYSVFIANWHDAWELSEPEDYACQEAWAPLVESYKNYQSYDFIKSKFYIDNLAGYQLLIMALGISDNWGNKNNYFSIRNIQKINEDNSRIIITPWDMDTSLGGDYKGSYYGGNLSNDWPVISAVTNNIQPFTTCNIQAEYKLLLHNKWVEFRSGALSVDNISQKLKEYRDLLINSGAWQRQWYYYENKSAKPCIVENLTDEINYIIDWYQKRYQEMDDYFNIAAGIENRDKVISNNIYYDLQGRKIDNKNLQRGIYINKGKKVIIK